MQTKSIPYTFNRCGYYYFSRRVPADLTGYYSYPRIVQGLRTRSPSQAKTRALIAAAKLDEYWCRFLGCCKRSVHSQELFLNIRVSSWLFTSIGADRSVRQSGLFIFFKLHRCIVFLCQRAKYFNYKGNLKLCQINLTDQVIV